MKTRPTNLFLPRLLMGPRSQLLRRWMPADATIIMLSRLPLIKSVKSSWRLCLFLTGIIFLNAGAVRAQLIDVNFTTNSYYSIAGGTNFGPTMSGAAVLGQAGDQWNGINVSSGTAIPLIYASGSNSPVTMTFTSNGGYNVFTYGGTTPFLDSPYEALMENYLYTSSPQIILLSGLAANTRYNLVLYNAADTVGAGRTTYFTVNSTTLSSKWSGTSGSLIQGTNYVEFFAAMSDGSGNLTIGWAPADTEGDINGFQIVPNLSQSQTVTRISAGNQCSLFVRSDGSLWGMGINSYGQLGLGSAVTGANVPQEIVANNVGLLSCGAAHCLFQRGNVIWAMGINSNGQLGDHTTDAHYIPEAVVFIAPRYYISALAGGGAHSLFAVTQDFGGSSTGLEGMGWNAFGQLGDGTYNDRTAAEGIASASAASGAISSVAAGSDFSLYVLPNGSLWGMGRDEYGQLGTGLDAPTSNNLPQMIVSSGVTAIAAGDDYSLFIKSDGTLWAMGSDQFGQFGNNVTGSYYYTPQIVFSNMVAANVVSVAAGEGHTLCLTSDGILWSAGDDSFGELGIGMTNSSIDIWFPVARNVVAAAAGGYSSFFIKSDGSLWDMGENFYGQLGTGDYANRYVPVEIVPPPQPAITGISVAGTNVVVTWPTNQGGFYLASTTNLAPPSWNGVSATPVIVNGQYTVTNPISASHQFYQLIDGDGSPPPSFVTTLPVRTAGSPLTTNSADMWASVNTNGASLLLYFEYGLTTNYGSITTPISGYSTSGLLNVTVSGLSANTTYHFQAVAYNSSVTNYGGDLTFKTASQ